MKTPISEQSKRYRKVLKIMLLSAPILYVLSLASLVMSNSNGSLGMLLISLALITLTLGVFGQIGTWIADVAASKGRSWMAFFWLSMVISPLITGLIVSSMRGEDSNMKSQAPSTLADELSKLESLQKSGVISDEEFKKAKAKILGN